MSVQKYFVQIHPETGMSKVKIPSNVEKDSVEDWVRGKIGCCTCERIGEKLFPDLQICVFCGDGVPSPEGFSSEDEKEKSDLIRAAYKKEFTAAGYAFNPIASEIHRKDTSDEKLDIYGAAAVLNKNGVGLTLEEANAAIKQIKEARKIVKVVVRKKHLRRAQ